MAAYDRLAKGASQAESTTGQEVSVLVSQILSSVIKARPVLVGEESEVLSSMLDGISTVLPAGYGPSQLGVLSGLGDGVSASLGAIVGNAAFPTVNVSSVAELASGESLSLPLRGVAGVFGGLLSLLRGGSPGPGAETLIASPFEFPAMRNASLALGPDHRADYGLDYRYDGQARRILDSEPTERRVEIHIQALDARSILDRKEELAEAVRQAMSSAGAGQEALLGY